MSFAGLKDTNVPHLLQTHHLNLSERSIMLSFINRDTPWLSTESLSISPILKPPPLRLPSVGCLVKSTLAPTLRTFIFSATICFNLK